MCLGNFTLSTWTSQCLRSCLHGLCTFSSAGNLMLYIFSNLILNVLTYLVPLSIALKISYSPVWHISTNIVERIHWDKNMFVLLSEWSICCKKKKTCYFRPPFIFVLIFCVCVLESRLFFLQIQIKSYLDEFFKNTNNIVWKQEFRCWRFLSSWGKIFLPFYFDVQSSKKDPLLICFLIIIVLHKRSEICLQLTYRTSPPLCRFPRRMCHYRNTTL